MKTAPKERTQAHGFTQVLVAYATGDGKFAAVQAVYIPHEIPTTASVRERELQTLRQAPVEAALHFVAPGWYAGFNTVVEHDGSVKHSWKPTFCRVDDPLAWQPMPEFKPGKIIPEKRKAERFKGGINGLPRGWHEW